MELSDADLLNRLMRTEMTNVPFEHWGFFFPGHVAVWRFIEAKRPGVLGQLKAAFRSEPYFEGKGATWFCDVLGNDEQYLDLLEAIIYPVTSKASTAVRERVLERGFFLDNEILALDAESVRRLAEVVLSKVDEGVRKRLIA